MAIRATPTQSIRAAANVRPAPGSTAGPLTHGVAGSILALGADTNRLCACLLEPVNQRYRLLAHRRTPRDPERPLAAQLTTMVSHLGDALGRTLWMPDGRGPLMESRDPVGRPAIEHVVGAVTLRPWLSVWLAGLSAQGSLAATEQALAHAPAQIVGQTVLLADANVSEIAVELAAAAPDVLLLCGGYEVDEPIIQASMMRLIELFVSALDRLAPAQHPTVLYAGNQAAAATVEQLWRTRIPTVRFQAVDNVLPRPGRVHLAALVDALNGEHQRLSQRTPDFYKISNWLTGPSPLLSTESAFVRFARVWMTLQRMDDLHAVLATPERWMHVRLQQATGAHGAAVRPATPIAVNEEIELYFARPGQQVAALAGWPAPRLVSGAWPDARWPRPQNSWWDRTGMVPMLAAVGQISPDAMQQIIEVDVF
ncbi:MAG: glutamate mutase L [Caldilineaceae bacterium]|nr:glutamate mutase L [Caldilineaceae bacterium]